MDYTGLILTGIGLALGVGFIWAKVEKVRVAMKEMAEAMLVFTSALEDKKITAEEWKAVMKESQEAWTAIKAIVSK